MRQTDLNGHKSNEVLEAIEKVTKDFGWRSTKPQSDDVNPLLAGVNPEVLVAYSVLCEGELFRIVVSLQGPNHQRLCCLTRTMTAAVPNPCIEDDTLHAHYEELFRAIVRATV
ncbi:MAG TPA: hypothetical protein VFZ48_00890 [Candidatus Saccharimonadales bacterium]